MGSGPTSVNRWLVLLALAVGNAVAHAGSSVLSAVLPLVKAEFRFSDTELGLLTGYASAASFAVLAIPLARLSQRFGKSLVLTLSTLTYGIAIALTGACSALWQLVAMRFVASVGPAAAWPVGQALICDHFPPHRRSGALAVHTAGDFAGSTLPLIAGGWIATRYGWRAAFFTFAVAALVVAFVQWRVVRDRPAPLVTDEPADRAEPALSWRAAAAALFRRRSYLHIVLGFSWASFAVAGLSHWMPSFYNRQFGLTPAAAAAMFGGAYAFGALLGLVAGGWMGNWLARNDPARLVVFCMVTYLCTFPCIALVFFAPNLKVAFAAHVAATMFGSMPNGPLFALIHNSVPASLRALASSLFLLTMTLLGGGGGPLLIGVFSDQLAGAFGAESLKYAMLAVKLLGLMLFLHLWLALRHVRSDMESTADAETFESDLTSKTPCRDAASAA